LAVTLLGVFITAVWSLFCPFAAVSTLIAVVNGGMEVQIIGVKTYKILIMLTRNKLELHPLDERLQYIRDRKSK